MSGMTPEELSESLPAVFSVTVDEHPDWLDIVFEHAGGEASHLSLILGLIEDDGKAHSGDGMDVGARATDVHVVVLRDGRIDPSSVAADYVVQVRPQATIALFARWQSSPASTTWSAAGVAIEASDGGTWLMDLIDSSDRALDYMRTREMLTPDDAASSPPIGHQPHTAFHDLSVLGYRGFATRRTLHLAQPDGQPGSGITVIVGANNSGKSTFLEALHYLARARYQTQLSFPQPRRHRDTDEVLIELTRADGVRLRVASVRAGSSQASASWAPDSTGPDRFEIQVTPSRRQFSPYFSYTGASERNWGLMEQDYSRTQLRENFVGRLRKVDQDASAREKFDALLTEILGYELNWTIDEIGQNQQFLKLIESDGSWHTSEGLGDGLISLLFIVDALYDSEPGSLIAVDEPELSLHPQLVKRLAGVFSRFGADRQIVIATHSPLLVSWDDITNGATIARVFKRAGRSEIAQPSREILLAAARLADSRNLRNPHTVGAAAREAFFAEEGILLVEGQDDVAYLPRVLADLGLPMTDSVYGWGAGGADNIPTIAKLFRELGFTRIAALLDDNKPETVARLESMEPPVFVRTIPASDIRHKRASPAKDEVLGLLEPDDIRVRADLRVLALEAIEPVLDYLTSEDKHAQTEDPLS